MPPKKGKKKGTGKKTTAKLPIDEITFKEAALTYRIQLKNEQIFESKNEIETIRQRIDDQQEKNLQLNLKKEQILDDVVQKVQKETESRLAGQACLDFKDVERALMETFSASKNEDKQLKAIEQEIASARNAIIVEKNAVDEHCLYRDSGQFMDAEAIDSLQRELAAMQLSYDMLSEHLQENITMLHDGIETYSEKNIEERKHLAGEKAMQTLDAISQQEMLCNKLLREEIEIHKCHYEKELLETEALERNNLEILSGLFDCQLEDIEITRQFYSDCTTENAKLDGLCCYDDGIEVEASIGSHSLVALPQFHEIERGASSEDEKNEYDPRDELLYASGSELKMLCVIGRSKTIHTHAQDPDVSCCPMTADSIHASDLIAHTALPQR